MPSDVQLGLIEDLCHDAVEGIIGEDAVLKRFGGILYDQMRLLESAIDILDNDPNSISLNKNESSGRIVWKVRGSQGNEYTCLNGFCSCPSYMQQVRQTQDPTSAVFCKHMLAVRVAKCLQKYQLVLVNNDKFIELLCNAGNSGPSLTHYGSSSFGNKWQR